LYNLLHLDVDGDEEISAKAETDKLKDRIKSVEKKLKSLYTMDDTQGTKRRCTDVGGGGRGGGGGQGTANSAELRAHGYEVQSQVIVDDDGTWEPLLEVWQPLST
jgi:hypothetical protein